MSVYIKGMKMPKDGCMDCPMHKWTFFDGEKCCITDETVGGNVERGGFPTNCPLVPVPEHGRTIDADALDDILADQSEDAYNRTHAPRSWKRALSAMRDYLEDAPTIIPADKEGVNG